MSSLHLAEGRCGSVPLNGLLKKAVALCFAGGLFLRVVYIPTEHNPTDYPSRNERIPGRRRPLKVKRCPTCGLLLDQHPKHIPKRLRGTGLVCKGALGYVHQNAQWTPWFEARINKLRSGVKTADRVEFFSLYDALVSDDL